MSYAQPHPRFSVLSSSSLASGSAEHLSPSGSSTRFSLPSAPSINTAVGAPAKPAAPRTSIYDRPLNKTRTAEVSAGAFAFLFSEVVQYTQKRVSGINDLERRYVSSSRSRSRRLSCSTRRRLPCQSGAELSSAAG